MFANQALAHMFGFETPEALKAAGTDQSFWFSHPGWRSGLDYRSSAEVRGLVTSWTKPDGSTTSVHVNVRAVPDAQGAIQFIEGSVEDITELLEAQEELGRKARYLSATNRVIAAAGTSTDAPGLLAACLESTLHALGLRAGGAWVGKHEHFVALPEDSRLALDEPESEFGAAIALADVSAILPEMPGYAWAAALARGQIVSAMAFPIFGEGRRVGGMVLASEQPRAWLEEEVTLGVAIASEIAAGLHRIEMSERAHHQDRLASVGQLAAGIAHDFNNILSAIILHAELLTDETGLSASRRRPDPHDPGARPTRLQPGRPGAGLQPAVGARNAARRPAQVPQGAGEIARTHLPETIRPVVIAEEGEFLLRADPTRLQQVLLNLSTNARDAMPGGGSLTFSIQRSSFSPDDVRPISDLPPGSWLILRVSDTGTGIPEDLKSHIFEPFFTTKAPGKGTGLGLSQVYGIVKQHEGFIDVSSAPGSGTTFTLCLPALASSHQTVADPALSLPRAKGRPCSWWKTRRPHERQ